MIKVSVQETIYSNIIKSMQIDNAPWIPPQGPFYLLDSNIVPYTPNPTILRIETDRVGEAISIEIDQLGDFGSGVDVRKKQKSYTVVASSSVVTTGVQLGQGRNLITVSIMNRSSDVDYLIINATTITALWEAFARVLYSVSTRIIDEQNRAISSDLATRLMEPYISFQELLPDIQSVKVLAIRLAAKGLLHSVGTKLGVTELIKSLSLSTPVYAKMDKDSYEIFPALDPWTKSASQFGGMEAHIWLPNVEIASWLAFLSFISNQPDLYEIQSINESEIVIKYQGDIQRHLFDFDRFGTSFLTSQASSECFKSIIINVTMASSQILRMCVGTYTFDLYLTDQNLLGNCRPHLDNDSNFDSGCAFDVDPIDPFTDGWIDLSLSGRFDSDPSHNLDTFVIPSTSYAGDICSFDGWYTQMVKNQKYEVEIPANITVSGYIQEGLAWLLQSPDGNKWMVYVNHLTETLIAKLMTIPFNGDLVNVTTTNVLYAGVGDGTANVTVLSNIIETFTLTAIDSTQFDIVGSISGNVGVATVGITFLNSYVKVFISEGSISFSAGDTFTVNYIAANVITNIPSTSDLLVGMVVTGSGIQSNTFITSVDSENQITISKDATGALTASLIANITTDISEFKVVKPDLTEVAFAITNEGVLQVITPIGGEILISTLYIVSDNETSVWWVTVNNQNILVIDKIFPV